jgi:hypothetical protein
LVVEDCIVAFTTTGAGVVCREGTSSAVDLRCSNIYGNVGGDWVGCIVDQADINGNFSSNPLFCDVANGDFRLASLSGCLPENNACGSLVGVLGLGCETPTGIVVEDPPPCKQLSLFQNYPNPFNPTTTISLTLPERERVTLSVYDVKGGLVKTLLDCVIGEGYQERIWDGKDSRGNQVSTGVYFYRLVAGDKTLTKKMVLIR